MTARCSPLWIVCLAALVSTGCGKEADNAPPVAGVTVSVARPDAMVGGPVEMVYTFTVPAGAPALPADEMVFVHFKDSDGELMWTDDHQPPTPVADWTPGATITYTRTLFVPKIPYVGETRIEVGLYAPKTGERLPLAAPVAGKRSYAVASFNLQLQSDALFVVFKDGWHPTEQAADNLREWQWSKRQATLAFRNPRTNVVLYLQLDRAAGFPEPQEVTLRIGNAEVDRFALPPNGADLRKVRLTATQLGEGDVVEVQVAVDRTFVPGALPGSTSTDPRELGVRVFRAFVEPAL